MNTTTLPQTETQAPASNGRAKTVTPLANIVETTDGYLLEAEMPGVPKDGVEITVENGELTVHGRRTAETAPGQELYRESRGWDYQRVFELDPSIDVARVSAKMEQGVLRLHLPKSEALKRRTVAVTD